VSIIGLKNGEEQVVDEILFHRRNRGGFNPVLFLKEKPWPAGQPKTKTRLKSYEAAFSGKLPVAFLDIFSSIESSEESAVIWRECGTDAGMACACALASSGGCAARLTSQTTGRLLF